MHLNLPLHIYNWSGKENHMLGMPKFNPITGGEIHGLQKDPEMSMKRLWGATVSQSRKYWPRSEWATCGPRDVMVLQVLSAIQSIANDDKCLKSFFKEQHRIRQLAEKNTYSTQIKRFCRLLFFSENMLKCWWLQLDLCVVMYGHLLCLCNHRHVNTITWQLTMGHHAKPFIYVSEQHIEFNSCMLFMYKKDRHETHGGIVSIWSRLSSAPC